MSASTTEARLRRIIAEHLFTPIDPRAIKPEASFREDMGADSIDIAGIAMAVEDDMYIRLTDDEVAVSMGDGTLASLCELVDGKLAEKIHG